MGKKSEFGIDNWYHFIGGAVANAIGEGAEISIFHWEADKTDENQNGRISISIRNVRSNDARFPAEFLELVDVGS